MNTTLVAISGIAVIGLVAGTSFKIPPQQQAPPNSLSAMEKKDGWKLLFDGNSTTGWHSYGKKKAGAAWQVVDGTLHMDAGDKNKEDEGDLVTDAEYENYDLKLEWKISKNGNSGIIFDIKEESKYEEPWHTGPEMQVLDNDGHSDGKIHKHRAGDLYDLIASSSEPVKTVGDWNMAEIKLNRGKLDLFLNGINVVSTTMWDENWWKLVKASKFASKPDFSKFKTGRIGLQDHGNDVWFRNIKIKQL